MFNDKKTNKTPIHKLDSYLFVNITKKELVKGSIRKIFFGARVNIEDGVNYRNNEKEIGEWFINRFGGILLFLKESAVNGEKTPDFLWNNNILVEIKESSGSNSSLNNAFKTGSKQIDNVGILLIDVTKSKEKIRNIIIITKVKMVRYNIKRVIVKRGLKLVVYYKKK
jgi:hypothetical protein